MGKMIFSVNDTLEIDFRKTIAATKGLHKGVIQEAIEEAITDWVAKNSPKI